MVTEAQWLAEYAIARLARSKGEEPPHKFWSLPKWEKPFRMQLRFALSLLKLYPASAISAALRTKQGAKIFSLGAKWLPDLCAEEARAAEAKKKLRLELAAESPPTKPFVVPEAPKTRPPLSPARPNLFQRLDQT